MVRMRKRILCSIYKLTLEKGICKIKDLSEELGAGEEYLKEELDKMQKEGLVNVENHEVELTSEGRRRIRVVFTGGAFEIIHYGHLHTLKKAKELGDFLVVVVARDKTVERSKGRKPIIPEQQREELVQSIKYVDLVVHGSEKNIYETLEKVRPDIVALGYDQKHDEEEIRSEASKRGIVLDVKRLDSPVPLMKSSKILNEI